MHELYKHVNDFLYFFQIIIQLIVRGKNWSRSALHSINSTNKKVYKKYQPKKINALFYH